MDTTKKVTSFETACEVLNLNVSDVFLAYPTDQEIATKKLKIIVEALNEGWKPDWGDSDEWKYILYTHEYKKGVGFSDLGCYFWLDLAFVSSRLCLRSFVLGNYAAKQFKDLFITSIEF
jgi:hypothetical protein